jgi:hypothetical protein
VMMATRAISRPYRAVLRQIELDRLRASTRPPPNPDAWITTLCDRCGHLFKFRGIARNCIRCTHIAALAGMRGGETLGQASGA